MYLNCLTRAMKSVISIMTLDWSGGYSLCFDDPRLFFQFKKSLPQYEIELARHELRSAVVRLIVLSKVANWRERGNLKVRRRRGKEESWSALGKKDSVLRQKKLIWLSLTFHLRDGMNFKEGLWISIWRIKPPWHKKWRREPRLSIPKSLNIYDLPLPLLSTLTKR